VKTHSKFGPFHFKISANPFRSVSFHSVRCIRFVGYRNWLESMTCLSTRTWCTYAARDSIVIYGVHRRIVGLSFWVSNENGRRKKNFFLFVYFYAYDIVFVNYVYFLMIDSFISGMWDTIFMQACLRPHARRLLSGGAE